MLKKILVATAFVTIIAAPAFARSDNTHARATASPSDVVIVDGKVVGQDPDPFIRTMLSGHVPGEGGS